MSPEILIAVFIVILTIVLIKLLSGAQRIANERVNVSNNNSTRLLSAAELLHHYMYKYDKLLVSFAYQVTSDIEMKDHLVEKGLQLLIDRHPLLRSRIAERAPKGKSAYYFLPMHSAKMDYHRSSKLASEVTDWETSMSEDLQNPLNVDGGPLWRVSRLDECKEEDKVMNTFVFTMHHAIVDAISMTKLVEEFLFILDRLHKGQEVADVSYELSPSFSSMMKNHVTLPWYKKFAFRVFEFLVRYKVVSMFSNEIYLYFHKFPAPCEEIKDIEKDVRVMFTCFDKTKTADLIHACKEQKCTVNGAVLAALSMAMAELLQDNNVIDDEYITSYYAVDFRRHIPLEGMKDYLGQGMTNDQILVEVPAFQGHDSNTILWELARQITEKTHKDLRARKYLKNDLFLQSLSESRIDDLTASLASKSFANRFPGAFYSTSNMGRYDEQLYDTCSFRMNKMFTGVGGQNRGCLYYYCFSTINGTLCLSLTYFPHVTSRNEAQILNSKIRTLLRNALLEP